MCGLGGEQGIDLRGRSGGRHGRSREQHLVRVA